MANLNVYPFGDNQKNTKAGVNTLGGKGYGLVEMTRHKLPVPEGLIIPTQYCVAYMQASSDYDKHILLDELMAEKVVPYLKDMKAKNNNILPLLSIRSGARVSMPGMMDTVLNIGLTPKNIGDWHTVMGDRVYNCAERLVNMFSEVVKGVKLQGAEVYTLQDLEVLTALYGDTVGEKFPILIKQQVRESIQAVWDSWDSPRAVEYRKINNIPDTWGTAVVIQRMVFGNLNDKSCSGVLFTRDPDTGKGGMMGEFLVNAQGEDVVAGTATPQNLDDMKQWNYAVYQTLKDQATFMEDTRKDMQDMEFTVEDGKLYILQTRSAKRSAVASFVTAWDDMQKYNLSHEEVVAKLRYKDYLALTEKQIDPMFPLPPTGQGIAASGSLVTGYPVFSNEDADPSKDCIFIALETTPADLVGINNSVGILTRTGGKTSHAAVVARSLHKTCVVGLKQLEVHDDYFILNGKKGTEDSMITIDGSTGNVWVEDDADAVVPTIIKEVPKEAEKIVDMLVGATTTEVEMTTLTDLIAWDYDSSDDWVVHINPIETLYTITSALQTLEGNLVQAGAYKELEVERMVTWLEDNSKSLLADRTVAIAGDLKSIGLERLIYAGYSTIPKLLGMQGFLSWYAKAEKDVAHPKFIPSPAFLEDVGGEKYMKMLVANYAGGKACCVSGKGRDTQLLEVLGG